MFFAADGAGAAAAAEVGRGAELALQQCPLACRAVTAAGAGQWSAGAGELVRLVYGEGVQAVLGPLDGRSAHLAEQVVTRGKGRFLLLTPWVSDSTLTRIKVPWFFRLVPDDRQQAAALLEELYGVRRLAVVLAQSQYDSRVAFETFARVLSARGAAVPQVIAVAENEANGDRVAEAVRAGDAEAVLFLQPAGAAARVVCQLRRAGVGLPFFGPLALATTAFLAVAGEGAEGMVLAAPAPAGPAAERFRSEYIAAYGHEPGAAAAYGYDGARVLLAALQSDRAGASPRAALAATRCHGLSGWIEFDAAGNRAGPAPLARVTGGRLQALGLNRDRAAAAPVELAACR
ncbi:MAG: ABC transporter substrate-binding protein [Deltaproteobacteria bacterium]|nr:ABC transporter substrate-binding protein [Deltaproteobacteria bacterium]